MSAEGWQLIVFSPSEVVPFRLPPGGRWIPNGRIVRAGESRDSLAVNTDSKEEAQTLAALAAERGLHGFIRPRFSRSKAAT